MDNKNLKDVVYDDVNNGLLFLETGVIVHREEYMLNREALFFGSYSDKGFIIDDRLNGTILGEFKNGKSIYNIAGLLKISTIPSVISDKKLFEKNILKYMKYKNRKSLFIILDVDRYNLDVFFLKYCTEKVIKSILWHLKRNRSIVVKIEVDGLKISYHTSQGVILSIDSICFDITDFEKEYEAMSLELAPVENNDDTSIPTSKEEIDKLLEPVKKESLSRKTETDTGYNNCVVNDNTWMHPSTIRQVIDSDDKLIMDAFYQLLDKLFNKEKYTGISIRIPTDTKSTIYGIISKSLGIKTAVFDLYLDVKVSTMKAIKYVIAINQADYCTDLETRFTDTSKILDVSIDDLEIRILDVLSFNVKESSSIEDTINQLMFGADNVIPHTYELSNQLQEAKGTFDGEDRASLVFSATSLSKRIPDPTWSDESVDDNYEYKIMHPAFMSNKSDISDISELDRVIAKDVIDDTELKIIEDFYKNSITSASMFIKTPEDRDRLSILYRSIFKKHIDIGVLYHTLKFNYTYGYAMDNNGIINYGIIDSNTVPFDVMLTNKPINIHLDIIDKYNVLVKTQSAMMDDKYLDTIHADKVNKLYKTIFKRYIELNILNKELFNTVIGNKYNFPDVYNLYTTYYKCQYKPVRLYNVFIQLVNIFNKTEESMCFGSIEYINTLYRNMFSSYIDSKLMYELPRLNTFRGTLPTLDEQWLR